MHENIIKTEAEKLQIDVPLIKGELKGDTQSNFIITPNTLRLESKKYP
jgi:hypothetical protein